MKTTMLPITLLLTLLTLVSLALSAALKPGPKSGSAATPSIGGADGLPYPIVPSTISGTASGQDFNLTGSVGQVNAKLEEMYPGSISKSVAGKDLSEREELVTRNKDGVHCFSRADWGSAKAGFAREAERQMIANGGRLRMWPRSCHEIYCNMHDRNWGTQVLGCNDRGDFIYPALPYLASYVSDIRQRCVRINSDPFNQDVLTQGQEFDTDRYNIIVRGVGRCW